MDATTFTGVSAPAFSQFDEPQRREFWAALALRHTPGLGARLTARLLTQFGSAWEVVRRAKEPGGWKPAPAKRVLARAVASGVWREKAREEWENARDAQCGILLWTSPDYPERLRHLVDAPQLLYCRGDISLLRAPAVAVVGSRACSLHGLMASRDIAYGLSRRGITVVSGLARGIDRMAHLAAMHGIGRSIAVLGAGIDDPYPPQSADARELLVQAGLLLSEYGPGATPRPGQFPVRNRLISGLSLAVLVVEAAKRSGSLVTARHALEQGRDVYAVPGPASAPSSFGCHDLVRQGARPVFSADDVLENLRIELGAFLFEPAPDDGPQCPVLLEDPDLKHEPAPENFRGPEKRSGVPVPAAVGAALPLPADLENVAVRIENFLRARPGAHLDEICRNCNLDAAIASRQMLMMELAGMVAQLPGMRYAPVNTRGDRPGQV